MVAQFFIEQGNTLLVRKFGSQLLLEVQSFAETLIDFIKIILGQTTFGLVFGMDLCAELMKPVVLEGWDQL